MKRAESVRAGGRGWTSDWRHTGAWRARCVSQSADPAVCQLFARGTAHLGRLYRADIHHLCDCRHLDRPALIRMAVIARCAHCRNRHRDGGSGGGPAGVPPAARAPCPQPDDGVRELRGRADPAQRRSVAVWGPDAHYYSDELQIAIEVLPGIRLLPDQVFVLALTLVLVLALHLVLRFSRLGMAMRAMAESPAWRACAASRRRRRFAGPGLSAACLRQPGAFS